ncbi:hypothetical protein MBANPS3_009713 [Mucor bainieri]
MEMPLPSNSQWYIDMLANITAEDIRYEYLNDSTKKYFRHTASTVVYMSVCLGCTIWQLMASVELIITARKWLHFAVLFETTLSFIVISCSILNPLTDVTCEIRFWVSIVAVNLGGCCIQTILLYKAYICYDRAKWLIIIGSLINTGYIALTFVYGTLGKVPTHKDMMGNCVPIVDDQFGMASISQARFGYYEQSVPNIRIHDGHLPPLAHLWKQPSQVVAFQWSHLLVIVGVIASNIVTAILISCRAMGGLSADLYSFDSERDAIQCTQSQHSGVITSYLLIKQFHMNKPKESKKVNVVVEDDNEQDETQIRKSITSSNDSFDIVTLRRNTVIHEEEQGFHKEPLRTNSRILENPNDIDLERNHSSDGVLSAVTTVNPGIDAHYYACPNCLAHLPPLKEHGRPPSP